MHLQLIRLTLSNFKGIRSLSVEPAGLDITILGENGTGKTTFNDAWSWLLTGKDSLGRKDFIIKTIQADGESIHNLSHEAEVVLRVDGETLALKKAFSEKWTKKRGATTAEFTGHTTQRWVDGVPVSEREYAARVAEIADETVLALVSSPTAFNSLHWQQRRKILLDVCGDVSDSDVIAASPDLADLPSILGKRKLEDHKKVIESRRKEINRELDRLPVRIDEATRSLPDISGINPKTLEADIRRAAGEIDEKRRAKSEIEAGGQLARVRVRLQQVEADLWDLEQKAKQEHEKRADDLRRRSVKARSRVLETKDGIERMERMAWEQSRQLASLYTLMKSKREEWFAANEVAFTAITESACPACGQDLPEERIAEAREKALSAFNLDKAGRLERISMEGKDLKRRHGTLAAENEDLFSKMAEARDRLKGEDAAAGMARAAVEATEAELVPVPTGEEYQSLTATKRELEEKIARLQSGRQEAAGETDREIESLTASLRSLESARVRIEQRRQGEARIADLSSEQKRLAAEFEGLERELYLCDEFTRAKVSMLTERINGRFRITTWKLFDVQVNGGIEEACVALHDGVPYSDMNHAAKINVGLDIINALSAHHGLTVPIFIDGRESVTELIPTQGQVVSLVVSPGDKVLRVESKEREAV